MTERKRVKRVRGGMAKKIGNMRFSRENARGQKGPYIEHIDSNKDQQTSRLESKEDKSSTFMSIKGPLDSSDKENHVKKSKEKQLEKI